MPDIKANAAVCEMCGGSLLLAGDGTNFKCENCGLLYPKDWVRAKVQEIKGTVRIEGAVQVEGIQSADKLSENAETFIKLQKYAEAINLFVKMQADYPHDYRGWWGVVRIRSNEFTDMSLSQTDYAGIISDGKSAIKVSNSSTADKLQRTLDDYVTAVYSHMSEDKKQEIQKSKALTENNLTEKETEREEKKRIFLQSENAYNTATATHSQIETEINEAEKSNKKVSIVLYAIATGWALFILISMIVDWDPRHWFVAVIGIILFGFVIPFGIANFITELINSSVNKQKKVLGELLSSLNKRKIEFEQAKTAYNMACGQVDSLEESKKRQEDVFSELSKEASRQFREEFISGKKNITI